jgi:D-tyrosyl-tRNA(Tyr) deacylase
MKVLLQRVSEAAVTVDGEQLAAIGPGLLLFFGVETGDGEDQLLWMADKVLGLRIFPDAAKPMNLSVTDTGGDLLVVSQFTLVADTSRGKRPGFSGAATPQLAESLYRRFIEVIRGKCGPRQRVCSGRFGADMQVSLVNDGPVTFLLER